MPQLTPASQRTSDEHSGDGGNDGGCGGLGGGEDGAGECGGGGGAGGGAGGDGWVVTVQFTCKRSYTSYLSVHVFARESVPHSPSPSQKPPSGTRARSHVDGSRSMSAAVG